MTRWRPELDTHAILEAVLTVPVVENVHHMHLCQTQEHEPALDAHIVIKEGIWNKADQVKRAVKSTLGKGFGVTRITLELECYARACDDLQLVGHAGNIN